MTYEELERENALKLKQILDLEDALYATRLLIEDDGSPCWCAAFAFKGKHEKSCLDAQKLTEHLWKKDFGNV